MPNGIDPATMAPASSRGLDCRICFAPTSCVLCLLAVLGMVLGGCGSQSGGDEDAQVLPSASTPEPLSPRLAAEQALQQKDFVAAEQHIQQALIASPGDLNALKLAAEIAFASGDNKQAARWVIQIARESQFKDEQLLQQCAVNLLQSGMLFETIELLEEAVEQRPKQVEIRRNLVQLLFDAEQPLQAHANAQMLIRSRAFDKDLLFLMATYEQRDIPPGAMNSLHKVNPTDKRLEIAKLRVLYDNEQWELFPAVSKRIRASSPEFLPAWLLQGQYLVETNQVDQLPGWLGEAPADCLQHWQYWEVLGDWARQTNQYPSAVRAYFEASRRDPMVASVAVKLARSLGLCNADDVPADAVQIARERGEMLNRFLQAKERFHKLRRRSNATIIEMATLLQQLGRLWEAEAWTAVGLREPDEEAELLQRVRDGIVAKLREDTPWQITEGQPYLSLDLSSFPRPVAEQLVEQEQATRREIVPSRVPRLVESANERGLIDAAYPADTVSGGIIPLYAQLGFGGAALDFDADGWTDVFLAGGGNQPMSAEQGNGQLFRNLDGHFVDTSRQNQIDDRGYAQGVVTGDINEDGFTDVVLLRYGRDQVFFNNGDGTFSERETQIKDQAEGWSTSGAIADIDLDGLSDFVCLEILLGARSIGATVYGSHW